MKVKHLESKLQGVSAFSKPKIKLEQYPTTPHLAAHVLFAINELGDIEDKFVVDLGVGGGILGIGASFLGCRRVLGIDLDQDALDVCKQNCEKFDVEMDLVKCDVPKLKIKDNQIFCAEDTEPLYDLIEPVDVVIMNPPFGTKIKGIDMVFLQKAIEIANISVYSLHKTSTRNHVIKKAKQFGATGEVIAELRFDIPKMYQCHKEKSVDVEVDLLRFTVDKD